MTRSDSGATKVALVTAGAKRIGKAISVHLASLGYNIALHFNTSQSEAEATAEEIRKTGVKCELFHRDFSDFANIQSLIPDVKAKMGAPVILVNNASPFIPNKLLTTAPEAFDLDFLVQVKAPFFLSQSFAKETRSGQIINLVDTAVLRYATDYFTYLLSKKALYELTKMAARELAPHIRVNAIAPGIVLKSEGGDEATYQMMSQANPLHRRATMNDVVAALDYLVRSEQVTGDCLFVDGGDCVDY